jgi:hypothetical protein
MKLPLLSIAALAFLVGCSNILSQQSVQKNLSENSPVQDDAQDKVQENTHLSAQANVQKGAPQDFQASEQVSVSPKLSPTPQSPEVALASYLNQSGAVLYDAEDCTYCRKQQSLFGSAAFQRLNVVNCGPWDNPYPECRRLGIRIFPTWDIGGRRYPTILPLDELASISGFNNSSDASARNVGGLQ